MMKAITLILFLGALKFSLAQFHNLPIPRLSPRAKIAQQIGVTWIEINFGSPSVQGRDVWNNPHIIPQNGEPIAWRAGANENTTIKFETDVFIEGKPLKAGSYGLHILPNDHTHTLLFSDKDNLWGSYYLDLENDIALRVEVQDTAHSFTEHLAFEFLNRTDSSAIIALNWGDRSIPFQVSTDLNKMAIEKFRYELNGENTYRWQAWNDAAAWCEERSVNLEEALTWVDRSINGGYGGFGGNRNLLNLSTKIKLLHSLERNEAMNATINEANTLNFSIDEAHSFSQMLIEIQEDERAIDFLTNGLKTYENEWGMQFIIAIAYYYDDNLKKAEKYLKKCKTNSPDFFHPRVEKTLEAMKSKRYSFPNRT